LAQQRKDAPEDTLAELESLGERLMQWVGANPMPVLGTALAILLVAAGIGGYRAYAHSRADRASAALAALQAELVVAMGGKPTDIEVPEPANPETARTVRVEFTDRYLALAKDWEGTPTAALALLEAGQLQDRLGNRDRALELWMQATTSVPGDAPALGVLQSRIGHLQEDRGDFEAAARAHEAAAAVPGFPLRADALADAARCWAEAAKPAQALALFARLKTEHPEHRLDQHVEARLLELEARAPAATASAPPAEAAPAPATSEAQPTP
jgi:tetratricopeptide (TPR) repeat protein